MSFHDRVHHAHTALVALLIAITGAALGAQAPEPLFADAPDSPGLQGPATADSRPYLVRSRTALLRVGVLDRALASPATSSLTLNLFDDVQLALTLERIEDSGFGHRSWVGHISDRPLSGVTLTFNGDAISGLITDGTAVYEIQGLGAGAHRIEQLDTTKMGTDTDIALASQAGLAADGIVAPALSAPSVVSTADIFVYYTTALRTAIGQSAVETRIAQHIADTNAAYTHSGISGQLRLVGFGELPVTTIADALTQLQDLTNDAGVNNQRDASGADLVALLVTGFSGDSQTSFTCGIAWVGTGDSGDAFSVIASKDQCVYTFAHETGHNLGGQHAPVDGGLVTGSGYPESARGFKAPGQYRTVMAYQCGNPDTCGRTRNFSSSTATVVDPPYAGLPTGNQNQRNADQMNALFPIIAAFRASTVSLPAAPQNLQATPNGLNITLQWQPPASGAAPANYRIVAGTQAGLSNIGQADVGLLTSVSATLPPGTYFVRVIAMNVAGSSPASNEVQFTLATAPPPGPPTNLTFGVNGNTLSLSWQPPTTGGPASDYLLEAGSASGLANIASGVAFGGTGLNVPGVPAGRYFIRVRARNAAGISAPSNEADVTVGPSCTLPTAPLSFTATKNGLTVTVSWSAPSAGVPSAYILQAGSSSGAANLFNGSVGLTTPVSAQAPPGTYFLRVLATNACGTGPASSEAAITVP